MGHNNLPPRRFPPQPEQAMPPLGFCVQCVADAKGAMAQAAERPVTELGLMPDLPGVSPAIMLVGGTGCCFAHLLVQVQSPLLVPNGMVPR